MVTSTLKLFAGKLRLSVFDHFVGLALKGLINASRMTQKRTMTVFPANCGPIKEHGFPEYLKPIILHALHRRTRLNTHEVKEVRNTLSYTATHKLLLQDCFHLFLHN